MPMIMTLLSKQGFFRRLIPGKTIFPLLDFFLHFESITEEKSETFKKSLETFKISIAN